MSGEVSYGRRLTNLAEQYGDATAVVYAPREGDEQPITWAELERRANQVAHLFDELGVGLGDLVVVGVKNSPEHVYATFGAWKVGATMLPLRYDLPAWERDRLLGIAEPKAVIGDWDDAPPGTLSSADLIAHSDGRPSDPPAEDRIPPYARLIATSGSTGRPKIIVTPSPAVHKEDPFMAAVVGESGGAVWLTTSPLYHTNGFAASYTPLLNANRVVLMERFDAAQAVDLIERHRVQHTIMVPTMLQRIARLPDVRSRDFSSIEQVIYGGATVPEWVVRVWLDLIPPERFIILYGSSESVGTTRATGADWLERPGTVGRPIPGCALKIVGDGGKELPPGEVGEIYMRMGDGTLMFRYVGQDTPQPDPEGFSTIGDMGWVDEDGYLYIADRRQDMIISGGANVFPAEIEAALSEHPQVVDSVVIGLPDPEWGHRVHAIVQPDDPAHPPTEEELRTHCKARLAAYKVPKAFEIVERIPRSAAGKVNRTALAAERAERAAT